MFSNDTRKSLRLFAFSVLAGSVLSPRPAIAETPSEPPQTIVLERLGIAIDPPLGWEIRESFLGKSLILQEPKVTEITDYSKPVFQRNITIAVAHETTPIDDVAAQQLREQLVTQLGSQHGVSNFRLDGDVRFFDYKGSNDGLIVYSFFDYNDIPMTQMHMVVAGENNRVLLSYTDLADSFESNLNPAWQSMASIQVVGAAPQRYEEYIRPAVVSGSVILLILLFTGIRRARYRRMFGGMDEDFATDESFDSMAEDLTDFTPISSLARRSSRGARVKKSTGSPRRKPRIRANSKGVLAAKSEPTLPPLPVPDHMAHDGEFFSGLESGLEWSGSRSF